MDFVIFQEFTHYTVYKWLCMMLPELIVLLSLDRLGSFRCLQGAATLLAMCSVCLNACYTVKYLKCDMASDLVAPFNVTNN